MQIITIPGPAADALGGNIMTAIATMYDGIVLPAADSARHNCRAYRGISNKDASLKILLDAAGTGTAVLTAEARVHVTNAIQFHDARAMAAEAMASPEMVPATTNAVFAAYIADDEIRTPYDAAALIRDGLDLLDTVRAIMIDATGKGVIDFGDPERVIEFTARIVDAVDAE